MITLTAIEQPKKDKQNAGLPQLPIIIAVDFDGTLCYNRWPEIGRAMQPVIDWLILQKAKGVKLILWTMREGEKLDDALRWCADRGLTFDAVNDNLPEVQERYGNNPRKVFANYYLDDSNI